MRFLWVLFLAPILSFASDKILILIIASNNFPVYEKLQEQWRSYMDSDPEHIKVYFLKGDPDLATPHRFEQDTIWIRTTEGYVPQSAGIINKTILALEALSPRLSEFQYVLRTNLSSFYVFPRLLKYVHKLPKTRCYSASPLYPGSEIGSGCGFLISSDVARLLAKNKNKFLGRVDLEDDQLIGRFLKRRKIPLLPHARCDFSDLESFLNQRDHIPQDVFHFRVKTVFENRLVHDIFIHSELLKMFYGVP